MDYQPFIDERNTSNPFPNFVGIRVEEMDQGYAKVRLKIEPHHYNPVGAVHGGCIYTVADLVGGCANMSYGTNGATISSDFHYLNPARDTKELIGVAKVIKYGKRIRVFDVEVLDEEQKMIAKGTFSYYDLGVAPLARE